MLYNMHNLAFCNCGPQTGLSISHSTPTTADISWKPHPEQELNTIVIGYTVQVVGPDSVCDIPVSDVNTTSVSVSELRPCTSYTFNVSAQSKTGTGPIVATISSTTPERGEAIYIHMHSMINIMKVAMN